MSGKRFWYPPDCSQLYVSSLDRTIYLQPHNRFDIENLSMTRFKKLRRSDKDSGSKATLLCANTNRFCNISLLFPLCLLGRSNLRWRWFFSIRIVLWCWVQFNVFLCALRKIGLQDRSPINRACFYRICALLSFLRALVLVIVVLFIFVRLNLKRNRKITVGEIFCCSDFEEKFNNFKQNFYRKYFLKKSFSL